MARGPDSTLPSRRIPTVVLIGSRADALERLVLAVRELDEVPNVRSVELKDAATVVAESRPFAVVVPRDLFAFDPREFEALARDVGALVIAYDADASGDALAATLTPKVRAAFRQWRGSAFSAR